MAKLMIKNNLYKKIFLYVLLLVIAIPIVFAVKTGFSPLDKAFTIIGNVFSVRAFLQNSVAKEGFFKFLLLCVLFAVSHAGFKKIGGIFDNKTARIVAFAFSMIGTFLVPARWADAQANIVTAVISSIIFIGIFWGGAYYATMKLNADNFQKVIGLLLIFLLIFFLSGWEDIAGLAMFMIFKKEWFSGEA